MAGPIMLGAVSFAVMDFVDKIFVSSLGIDHLAAVGSGGVWAYTFALFFAGVTGCVSAFVAQSYGKGNLENCARFTWQSIYIAIAGGLLAFALIPLAVPLFSSMRHSAEVTRLETIYFQIRMIGVVFMAWQVAIAGFFQAISRPIIPMAVGVGANLTNVLLDYVLIFGKFGAPALGIAGAAIATVIALALECVVLQYMFMSRSVNETYHSRRNFAFDWAKCRDVLRIGWPSGVSGFLDVFGWSIFTSFIVGGFGTVALAAHTATLNLMHFSFIPVIALSQAATALVGQWIGRDDIPTAKARAYTAVKIGMIIMVSVGLLFALYGRTLMTVFSDDPEVIKLGAFLLILAAIFAGFDAISIVLIGALRGAGDTRWIMIALTTGAFLVNLPLAWLFAFVFDMKAMGAWIGVTLYVISLSAVILYRFHGEAWRHIRIFSEEHLPVPLPPEAAASPIALENTSESVQP